jgi:hypothetical protein
MNIDGPYPANREVFSVAQWYSALLLYDATGLESPRLFCHAVTRRRFVSVEGGWTCSRKTDCQVDSLAARRMSSPFPRNIPG